MADSQTEAWESVLAALEADAAALERLLGEHDAGGPAPASGPPAVVRWAPPAGLGPLPAGLAARARALEAAQRRIAVRLAEARARAAAHIAALRAVPPARQDAPVYLDAAG